MPSNLNEAEVEAAVESVFAAPPFTATSTGTRDLWIRSLRRLGEWYDEYVTDLYFENPEVFWPLVIALGVLLALLLLHVGVSMREVYQSLRSGGTLSVKGVASGAPLSLDEARRAQGSGDFRLAIELAWSIAIAHLIEVHGTAVAVTPRQQASLIYAALKERPLGGASPQAGQHQSIERLLRVHEGACYSGATPSRQNADDALADAKHLMTAAASP